MPLGFLKSVRDQASRSANAGKPAAGSGGGQALPERATVLSDVETLGIGMFWATDAQGRLSFLSQRALDDLGFTAEELFGKPVSQVFSDIDPEPGAPQQRAIGFKIKAHSRIEEHVIAVTAAKARSAECATRWWRLNGRPMTDAAGNFLGYRGSAVDITSQYAHEMQVARQSQIDELTGLANRRKLCERLTATLAAFRASQRSCAPRRVS